MSDIEEHRKKIEEITLEMIKLLKTRTDIAKQIGDAKASLGMTVTDEEREDALRTQVTKLCKEIDLDQSTALKFLNLLLNESVKVQSDGKQTHLSVFLKAKALEEKGKKIIHLEVGEPDFKPPLSVKTALGEVYDKGYGKYGPAKGITELRKGLAGWTNGQFEKYVALNLDQENIMVCPGARFAVYLAITTLLNPGDEIIVIEPAWPAYKDCALNAGIKVRTIKTTLETRWEPSIDQINNAINENTKMIVLNYPNNPTGKTLPEKLLDSIMQTAKEHDLYVLSDEIYEDYYSGPGNVEGESPKEILTYRYEKSIITKSFSKSFAMTGFRIGYAIAEPSIIEKMSKLQALSLTNVSEPIQYVALQVIDSAFEAVQENAETIGARLEILVESAKDIGLEFVEPDGAMYLFAKTKYKNFDATKFSEKLLEHGVAIAPGEGFGDYKEFFRITAIDETRLKEGMIILDTVLKESYE
ncbi:aminotransferase class I/II-fold pyridoxal phosphate-dependent enzyme [Marine Group I thaumarchaeote]|uniref:Aminotransferase n=1 Tax=Marine Group I thaumarchaeote TaxID=2511932 RepID=A0A7K4NSI4_9ARCH|nr:aminotransferase class I/II-fold pyridoxal phosphate-dependent enzyme [Marine Group I thaumarchaeote]